MKDLVYYIECRDKDNKPHVKNNGQKVGAIKIEREFLNVHLIEKDCEEYYTDFQTLTNSDNILIDVRQFNEYSKTYELMFSYYGREKRFIKYD